jgi:hypothetical protein
MHPVIIPWAQPRSMSTTIERNQLPYDERLRAHSVTREQHGS